MVNTPIPHSLKSEAKKAAKILREFTVPSAKAGPDKLIPAGLIAKARGLAILTVVKAGFLVTARGGSGIVIAKLEDDTWSAPSALGIAGLGGGFEIGAEVTDFVIILNSKAAVDAFSKGGNLTLGGNFTIAAGPLGRNLEGDVAVRSPAAIYTYSKTKGIFAGISIEGSGLIERKDANRKFYQSDDIRAYQILSGSVRPPPECAVLYEVLDKHEEMAEKALAQLAKAQASKHAHAAVGATSSGSKFQGFSLRSKGSPRKDRDVADGPKIVTTRTIRSRVEQNKQNAGGTKTVITTTTSTTSVRSTGNPAVPSSTGATKGDKPYTVTGKMRDLENLEDGDQAMVVRALYEFSAQRSYDLTLHPGDMVTVLTYTDSQNDWWEGMLGNKTGIFPANYVEVLTRHKIED